MAEKKRQCGTCRFFVETQNGGMGNCTHPLRKREDTHLVLIRPNELACRTQWGTSLWQHTDDLSDPTEPQTPQQPTLPEPIAAQLHFDDEVTSVSIAGSKATRPTFEDDVVDTGTVATGMASWNDPVQAERMALLKRSNHDAVAGAQKRFLEKQARRRDLVPFAEDDANTENSAIAKPEPEPAKPAANTASRPFPPDDFVEDERVSEKDDVSLDDEMVDEGIARGVQRTPRMRKLLRGDNDPKAPKAMKFSMPAEYHVTSNNPEQREQWNTVPAVNPRFELPLSKPETQAAKASNKLIASSAAVTHSTSTPNTLAQAREQVAHSRQSQARAQRPLVAPLADSETPRSTKPQPAPVTERPRLTQAQPTTASSVDQLKTSPLRGHHPATRKLIQRDVEVKQTRPEQVETPRSQRSAPTPAHRYDAAPEYAPAPAQRPQPCREEPRPQRSEPQPRAASRVPRTVPRTPFVREEIQIAQNVERRCGTCTSFRPGRQGDRGTCTNAWAGPVERMVYADELSCTRSFGSFWLPKDETIWLKEIKNEPAVTPRVDAMLEELRKKAPQVLPDLDELTS